MKNWTLVAGFLMLAATPAVARADITTGLIGHWRLDEGSGSSAADDSGNGLNGTLSNDPAWTAGKINGAVDLDGDNDRIIVTHNPLLNVGSISVALWMNPDVWSGGEFVRSLVSKQEDSTGYPAFDFRKGSFNTAINAAICVGTTNYSANGPSNPSAASWQHVAFTYDASTGDLIVYLNGAAGTPVDTGGGNLATTSTDLWFGGNPSFDTDRNFNGKVDDVFIYNRALSAQDVAELYARTGQATRSLHTARMRNQ